MLKFVKKPLPIEAVKASDIIRVRNRHIGIVTEQELIEYRPWINTIINDGGEISDRHIFIKTLEGVMRAEPTDFIIKGIRGEMYPCKPDIFEESYEPYTEE